MIRKSKSYARHPLLVAYKHRSSTYHAARPEEVDAIIAEVRTMTGVPEEIAASDVSEYRLPPKQPTPNVILRTDIMERRRSHLAL